MEESGFMVYCSTSCSSCVRMGFSGVSKDLGHCRKGQLIFFHMFLRTQ